MKDSSDIADTQAVYYDYMQIADYEFLRGAWIF